MGLGKVHETRKENFGFYFCFCFLEFKNLQAFLSCLERRPIEFTNFQNVLKQKKQKASKSFGSFNELHWKSNSMMV